MSKSSSKGKNLSPETLIEAKTKNSLDYQKALKGINVIFSSDDLTQIDELLKKSSLKLKTEPCGSVLIFLIIPPPVWLPLSASRLGEGNLARLACLADCRLRADS